MPRPQPGTNLFDAGAYQTHAPAPTPTPTPSGGGCSNNNNNQQQQFFDFLYELFLLYDFLNGGYVFVSTG